jgi:hypothetical protein
MQSQGNGSDIMKLPGMLPTLGLTKYKNVDLQTDKRNPFKVHDQTEKLLVVREREREFNEFNKLEKEGLRIFEKENQSRPNRKGVISEIRNIQANGLSTIQSGDGKKMFVP